ncbi:MAG: HIT domain-containing protein [Bryobacteraceae bacterium]|jgi:ATP adenylyltransferase
MDYLWTPWRYNYITGPRTEPSDRAECVFCAAAACPDDETALTVHRSQHNFIILNRFPYTSGHVMVVPYAHVATLEEMSEEALVEMMLLARDCEKVLRTVYHPDGLNLGLNIGRSAGAGVAGHIHLHALPRWTGDANFMTPIAETRVLPEDLAVTWQRLRDAFTKA